MHAKLVLFFAAATLTLASVTAGPITIAAITGNTITAAIVRIAGAFALASRRLCGDSILCHIQFVPHAIELAPSPSLWHVEAGG
jgi:hypothetical protein